MADATLSNFVSIFAMIETPIKKEKLFAIDPNQVADLRLFCFHYAGGNAHIFRDWHQKLPQHVQVVPVELPGHGTRLRESLLDSIPALVQEIATGITGYLDRPFVFFGHSMGALLSFEIARFLRRYFLPQPVHLYVSAHIAPHLSEERETIHQLPDDELTEKLRELNGTPEAVLNNPELRELFLPIIRNDFKVCETYQFKSGLPLDCPITVYGGVDDADVAHQELQAWGQHTTAGIQLRLIDGDHFFIHNQQDQFLRELKNDLEHLLHQERHQ
jgi:medium-chain acyl-[acyl-carrier-protein] hydrolase